MVSAIFTELASIITSFITMLGTLFTNIVQLFWTAGSGSDPGSLTILGVLLLISVASALVYFAFNLVRGLIRSIKNR